MDLDHYKCIPRNKRQGAMVCSFVPWMGFRDAGDEHKFSIDDGTGRGSLVFEFDR